VSKLRVPALAENIRVSFSPGFVIQKAMGVDVHIPRGCHVHEVREVLCFLNNSDHDCNAHQVCSWRAGKPSVERLGTN
jgi:hypothetical protein